MSTDTAPDFASTTGATEKRQPVDFGSASKFLFDLSFDADAPLRADAPPPVTLQVDELQSIKAAMYEDGRNAGRAEAMQAGADKAAEQMAYLGTLLQQLATDGHARAGTEVEVIAGAVKAIAQNLLPAYIAKHGADELDATVRDCLVQLKGEPRLVIRTCEAELDACIKRFDSLAQVAAFPGKLIILADNALASGDLRVEWADGGLERANGNLWAEVEKILSRGRRPQTTAANPYQTNTELNGEING